MTQLRIIKGESKTLVTPVKNGDKIFESLADAVNIEFKLISQMGDVLINKSLSGGDILVNTPKIGFLTVVLSDADTLGMAIENTWGEIIKLYLLYTSGSSSTYLSFGDKKREFQEIQLLPEVPS